MARPRGKPRARGRSTRSTLRLRRQGRFRQPGAIGCDSWRWRRLEITLEPYDGAVDRLDDGALKFVGLHALFLLTIGEIRHLDERGRHVGSAQYAHGRLLERPRSSGNTFLELFLQHGCETG